MEKKISAQYIRQPRYYKDFQCAGGDCGLTCCQKWIIIFSDEEVERLKSAQCSPELRELTESSFVPMYNKENKMMIKLTESGQCPFHNKEGLCAVQRELGEEYLSQTCRIYPRKIILCGNYILRSCVTSCIHVMSMICSDEDSMVLENIHTRQGTISAVNPDSPLDILNNPALKYRSILFDFFYEILSDRTRSIETSIALGAIAAQKLDECINQGKHDRIPEVIRSLKPQLNNADQIAKLESFKPNLSLKANFSAGLLKVLNNSDIYRSVFENGVPSEEKFNRGMEMFRDRFNGTPGFMRNIALNIYVTNNMPFRTKKMSLFESYSIFAAEVAVIKFLIPAVAVSFPNVKNGIEVAVSAIDRSFTHNDENVKTVIEYMKAFKCTSPAYLLGIIK